MMYVKLKCLAITEQGQKRETDVHYGKVLTLWMKCTISFESRPW